MDLYSQKNLPLVIQEKGGLKTRTGLVCSGIIILLSVAFAANAIIDLFLRNGMTTSTVELFLLGLPIPQVPIELAISFQCDDRPGALTVLPEFFYPLHPNASRAKCSKGMQQTIQREATQPDYIYCLTLNHTQNFTFSVPNGTKIPCKQDLIAIDLCINNSVLEEIDPYVPFMTFYQCFYNMSIKKGLILTNQLIQADTDLGFIFRDVKTEYSFFTAVSKGNQDIGSNAVFNLEVSSWPVYRIYQRQFPKIPDVLGNITGVWGLLVLGGSLFCWKLIATERKLVLYNYIKGRSHRFVSFKDYIKARFSRNKTTKEKIKEIESTIETLQRDLDLISLLDRDEEEGGLPSEENTLYVIHHLMFFLIR